MNLRIAFIAALSLAASLSVRAEPVQLLDAPGPGYRQQVQDYRLPWMPALGAGWRASGFIWVSPLPPEFFGRPSAEALRPNLSSDGSYLSKPIRLFDGPLTVRTGTGVLKRP